jgi:hypothetical protein
VLNRLKTVKSSLKGRSNPKLSGAPRARRGLTAATKASTIAMLMMTTRSVLVHYMMIQAL